jgi:hypothetical protein
VDAPEAQRLLKELIDAIDVTLGSAALKSELINASRRVRATVVEIFGDGSKETNELKRVGVAAGLSPRRRNTSDPAVLRKLVQDERNLLVSFQERIELFGLPFRLQHPIDPRTKQPSLFGSRSDDPTTDGRGANEVTRRLDESARVALPAGTDQRPVTDAAPKSSAAEPTALSPRTASAPAADQTHAVAAPALAVPEKVTLMWLLHHAPVGIWGGALSIAGMVFVAGLLVGQVSVVREFLVRRRLWFEETAVTQHKATDAPAASSVAAPAEPDPSAQAAVNPPSPDANSDCDADDRGCWVSQLTAQLRICGGDCPQVRCLRERLQAAEDIWAARGKCADPPCTEVVRAELLAQKIRRKSCQ